MPRDLVAWAFYSPRRLLAVVAALLLALTLAVTGAAQAVGGGKADAADSAAKAPEAAAAHDAASPRPTAAGDRALDSYGPATPDPDAAKAARKFVKAWLKGPSAKSAEAWLADLHPYVTSELYAGLAETDPARIPPAKIGSGEVGARTVGDYLNELIVPLEGGRELAVTLAYDGSVWRVTAVEEAETKQAASGP